MCDLNQYQNSNGTCSNCTSECKFCVDASNCNMCYDPVCLNCEDYRVCLDCGIYYLFKGQCFPECPFYTYVDGKTCYFKTETHFFNFTKQGMISGPGQVDFVKRKGPNPVYVENRGYYFGNSTTITSSQEYYFANDFNYLVMISARKYECISGSS